MKQILIMALLIASAAVADVLEVGKTSELTNGGIIKGAVLTSTNATQTATLKAVYSWPIYGSVTRESVERYTHDEWYDATQVLTNWCEYVTDTAWTNVVGGVTNVVYYDGIQTVTNRLLRPVEETITNSVTARVVTGYHSVTSTLYTLTAEGGTATTNGVRLVGAGAELLLEGAPITIFWE